MSFYTLYIQIQGDPEGSKRILEKDRLQPGQSSFPSDFWLAW